MEEHQHTQLQGGTHLSLSTSILQKQKHYTAYRSPEPKQWGEHSSIPP